MTKLYVNKVLFHLDRDPDLLSQYKADPRKTLERWEAEYGCRMDKAPDSERVSWHSFSNKEREALATHDYRSLFELGAHYFLVLQVFMGMYDAEFENRTGRPLTFQKEMASKMEHLRDVPWPSIEV